MQNKISKKVHYERLQNGVDLLLLKTHSKDVVVSKIAIPGGLHSTYLKQSVALLLSDLLPAGNKQNKKSDVLEKIEGLGASVSFSFGAEYIFINISSVKSVFEEVFNIVFDSITSPVITKKDFDTSVLKVSNILKQNSEDAKVVSERELKRLMFVKGNPHYRESVNVLEKEIKTLDLKSVIDFYKNTLSSVGVVGVVAGDINVKKFKNFFENKFDLLPNRVLNIETKLRSDKLNTKSKKESIVTIHNKPNIDSRIGIPIFITPEHSEFLALQFAIAVLGSSSTSRLFNILRIRKNLTYGAYANIDGLSKNYPGFLSVYSIFPNTVFKEGVASMDMIVKDFIEKGITKKEFDERKVEINGRFKIALSSTAGISDALFNIAVLGKPASYLDEYVENINSLMLKDVNNAVKKHLDYSLLKTVSAGAINKKGEPTN